MAIRSVSQVVEILQRQRVLAPPQLAELQVILPRFADPFLLIQDLLVRGWLTPDQAHKLFGPPPARTAPPRASYTAEKAASKRRWLKWNLIGLVFVAMAGAGLYLVIDSQRTAREKQETRRLAEQEAQARAEFEPLTSLFKDRYTSKDRLREQLLAFRLKYPEAPQALQAAELLAQLPSPLDRLARDQIPPAELFAEQPRAVVAVLGERAWRHWGAVRHVAASADQSLVASAADDGKVHVWDRRTGRLRATLRVDSVLTLAFVADSKFLAVGDAKGQVTLWEPATDKQYAQQGPVADVKAMAVSPLGNLVASAGADAAVKLWDLSSGQEKASLAGHREAVLALAFSRDGRQVASGGADALVRVWNSEGQEVLAVDDNQGAVRAIAFAADSKHVAFGGDEREIRIWSLEGKKKVADLKGHEGAIAALAFPGDGQHLVSAADDLSIKLWQVEKQIDLVGLQGHLERVNSLAFLGLALVTGSSDGTVRMWTMPKIDAAASLPVQQNILVGHQAAVSGVAFVGDGSTLISTSWDRIVRLWDVPKMRLKTSLGNHESAITSLALSSPYNRLATGSLDGIVKLWDTQQNVEAGSVGGHQGPVLALAFTPGGDTFATGVGRPDQPTLPGEFRWWGTASQAEVANLSGQAQGISGVAFSPDGLSAYSASWDGTVKIWNRVSARGRETLTDDAPIDALAVSPDGRTLATANQQRRIKLWDLATFKLCAEAAPDAGYISSLAFSPDGKSLASAHHDGAIRLWDPRTAVPQQDHRLPGGVRALAWAPDSRHLATANANGTVYILRLATPTAGKK